MLINQDKAPLKEKFSMRPATVRICRCFWLSVGCHPFLNILREVGTLLKKKPIAKQGQPTSRNTGSQVYECLRVQALIYSTSIIPNMPYKHYRNSSGLQIEEPNPISSKPPGICKRPNRISHECTGNKIDSEGINDKTK